MHIVIAFIFGFTIAFTGLPIWALLLLNLVFALGVGAIMHRAALNEREILRDLQATDPETINRLLRR